MDYGGLCFSDYQMVIRPRLSAEYLQMGTLPLFHGGNTGSNPVGDANTNNGLVSAAVRGAEGRARQIDSVCA
jgi:hypothetical protein